MERTCNLAECIPPELIKEIYANGKEQNDQHVYRVAKSGIINAATFWGTYEECQHDNRKIPGNPNEIGSYSTSCYLTPDRPKKFLNFLKKKYHDNYPCPTIIHGTTICGLSQLTKERIPDYKEKEHVDWWIYKDSFKKLEKNFKIYKEFEEEDNNE